MLVHLACFSGWPALHCQTLPGLLGEVLSTHLITSGSAYNSFLYIHTYTHTHIRTYHVRLAEEFPKTVVLLRATPFHQALLCHPHFDIVCGPDAGTSAMHVRALSDCMKMLLLTAPSEDNMRTLLESQGHPHLTPLSPKQHSERQEIYKDYADGVAALKKLKNKKVGLCSHAILPCTIHSLLWMAQLLATAHIILQSIKQTSNTALLATLSFPSLLCFAVSLLPLPLS
jgi:hypothetical protein